MFKKKGLFRVGYISFVFSYSSVLLGADLTDLNIEDLSNLQVYSANKTQQKWSDIPSAVYVITAEDIRRTGAKSIPEALKLAPGINAGKVDANKWSVGIRGNTQHFSNKLLVMIDGRTVYNPLFSGVYWEAQDVILEDIEQIEVIRGPGGTVWGSNAVNGIINIITKSSSNTKGPMVSVLAGNKDNFTTSMRYGAKLRDDLDFRIFGKYDKRDSFINVREENNQDDWKMKHVGMRADWKGEKNKLRVQGDMYHNDIHELRVLPVRVFPTYIRDYSDKVKPSGGNLLVDWDAEINEKTSFSLKGYYDLAKRVELITQQEQKTLDIDTVLKHKLNDTHNLSLGLGARRIQDNYTGSFWMKKIESASDKIYSGFLQDEISIVPEKWILTLGSKLEHNEYTSYEIQPNARLMWKQDSGNVAWAACSKGIRTPGRIEKDGELLITIYPGQRPFGALPVYGTIVGGKEYKSEKLLAYEAGYRVLSLEKTIIDLTVFLNEYDDLRSNELARQDTRLVGNHLFLPVYFKNNVYGHIHGFEAALQYQPIATWNLKGSYSELRRNFKVPKGSTDLNSEIIAENDTPNRTASLLSQYTFREKLDVDLWLKYSAVTELAGALTYNLQKIPQHFTADLRVAYKIAKDVELSVAAQNLNRHRHLEALDGLARVATYVPREYFIKFKYELS